MSKISNEANLPRLTLFRQQINLRTVSIQPIYADPDNTADTKIISMSTFGIGAIHDQLHFQSWKGELLTDFFYK